MQPVRDDICTAALMHFQKTISLVVSPHDYPDDYLGISPVSSVAIYSLIRDALNEATEGSDETS